MTQPATQFEAVIVGGGVSGIVTAARLEKDLGVRNVRIFERADNFGGTWKVNEYPGCGCDIPTRLYSISFEQRKNWSRFFSDRVEIAQYLQEVAQKYDLPARTEFRTEVVSATWDESSSHWVVTVRSLSDQVLRTFTARIVVSCVGALSIPRKCDVPGAEDFKGPLFHSAQWDHSVQLKDKEVVILGNGCTATQIVPEIAPLVKNVTQIVRSKHWYVPQIRNPMRGPVWQWIERNLPGFTSFQRWVLVLVLETTFLQAIKDDGKGARARFASVSRNYITKGAPPQYHSLLLPAPGELEVACKRRIFDAGYIPSLNRENVELTNDQAVRINEWSVTLRSGKEVKADVILLANGFQADKFALQMEIKGRKGRTLEQYWKQAGVPQAYRGTFISGFPNYFVIWGPNTVTGHFSAIWAIERSVENMITALRPIFLSGPRSQPPLLRSAGKSVEVSHEAEEKEQRYIQEKMKSLIFTSGCGSWYADQETGKVTAVAPTFQLVFAWRAWFPVGKDYIYKGLSHRAAISHWRLLQRFGSLLRLGDVPEVRADNLSAFTRFMRLVSAPFAWLWGGTGMLLLRMVSVVADFGLRYEKVKPYKSVKRL